ncbi:MAG TPA: type II toxin-antitoxin system HicA family toxin [Terriglobia bacterium]
MPRRAEGAPHEVHRPAASRGQRLTRLHPARARQVIRFLEGLAFHQVRQKGSHKFFRHPDGRTVTVPDHQGEDIRMLPSESRPPPAPF